MGRMGDREIGEGQTEKRGREERESTEWKQDDPGRAMERVLSPAAVGFVGLLHFGLVCCQLCVLTFHVFPQGYPVSQNQPARQNTAVVGPFISLILCWRIFGFNPLYKSFWFVFWANHTCFQPFAKFCIWIQTSLTWSFSCKFKSNSGDQLTLQTLS